MDYECQGCGYCVADPATLWVHLKANSACRDAHLEATVERAKDEIRDDIRAGMVPGAVGSFAELHDHVDANGYGGAFEDWHEGATADDAFVQFWNDVQEEIDHWLKNGRKG